jgi:hypothetical protein
MNRADGETTIDNLSVYANLDGGMDAAHAPIPMLNYAAPATTATNTRPRTPMQIALFVLTLPALMTPFVPFTYGTSPLDAVAHVPAFGDSDWTLYLIAIIYFAAFPILLWKSRLLLFSSTPRRWERRMLTVTAVIVTAPPLIVIGLMLSDVPELIRDGNFGGDEMLMLSIALGSLFIGFGGAARRWWRRDGLGGFENLLITGYLTNAAMCLLAFHDNPEMGYWLTAPVAASFAAEMLLPSPQQL